MRLLFIYSLFMGMLVVSCRTKVPALSIITWQVDSLPTKLYGLNNPSIQILSSSALQLTAGKGTDLHNPASGAVRKNNAPKLLFTPHASFDLWVKVVPQFNTRYDGGGLILYTDTANWAKLLFQYTGTSYITGMSVVNTHVTDDSYYPTSDSAALYLRLKKTGKVCAFYTSANGINWNLTRQFVYRHKRPAAVGFFAQSPAGGGCAVRFMEIRYNQVF